MAKKELRSVHVGTVVDNVDPQGGARVQVAVPVVSAKRGAAMWARLATLSAGDGRGTWFLPEVGDEVLVAFEGGDPALPIVIGSLWAAMDALPETGGDGARTTIRTRSGAVIRIEDADAGTPASITVDDASGDRVRIGPAGIEVRSSGNVTISAAARVEVSATTVEVDAATIVANTAVASFAGMLRCDTLVATSVIASSYSPGAGNVM
jgi:uncharacterized protein involved in type VI secretion and phage assembly